VIAVIIMVLRWDPDPMRMDMKVQLAAASSPYQDLLTFLFITARLWHRRSYPGSIWDCQEPGPGCIGFTRH
jgi:hypothetical protein